MTIRAVYPGTFDPITNGHEDLIQRASRLFDELIIAVYDKPLKSLVFSPEERLSLARQSFVSEPKISVMGYSGLTVDFCQKVDAQVIVRGLRVWALIVRQRRCPLKVAAEHLGSLRAAAHFHLLLEEIGAAWPEPPEPSKPAGVMGSGCEGPQATDPSKAALTIRTWKRMPR